MLKLEPPPGFVPIAVRCPFVLAMGLPLYQQFVSPELRHVGLRAGEAQCNAAGFLHGGFLLSLADFALSYGTFVEGDRPPGISLSVTVDFMRPAKAGEWLEIAVATRKRSQNLLFAEGLITADGKSVARASGLFSPVRPSA